MPKIVNFNNKMDFICEKAYEELIKNGVKKFSLNKFIESLNMSKGQFYYYFKTKEELISEVIDKKVQNSLNDMSEKVAIHETFYDKILVLFSFYFNSSSFDELIRDTFYLYLNLENQYIKQKNTDFYDYIFNITNNIFDDMIEKKLIKDNSKEFIPSLIATADGMYLQSMILENYDLKKNMIEYIELLDKLLKK